MVNPATPCHHPNEVLDIRGDALAADKATAFWIELVAEEDFRPKCTLGDFGVSFPPLYQDPVVKRHWFSNATTFVEKAMPVPRTQTRGPEKQESDTLLRTYLSMVALHRDNRDDLISCGLRFPHQILPAMGILELRAEGQAWKKGGTNHHAESDFLGLFLGVKGSVGEQVAACVDKQPQASSWFASSSSRTSTSGSPHVMRITQAEIVQESEEYTVKVARLLRSMRHGGSGQENVRRLVTWWRKMTLNSAMRVSVIDYQGTDSMGVIQLPPGCSVHEIECNRRPNLSCGHGRRPDLTQLTGR
ncbi:hypothetical protein EDB92DRAFT_1820482 [Lactarius akahatsu]|uniref:Uncharacterized protein n=1 Tax=Lactarius akahatsu TaxID=416441 RepID=A0AAD4L6V7_9AGAM|nr:hypothetical protein EDB92DRAFT_1820482 [Lactarius akahatsu]